MKFAIMVVPCFFIVRLSSGSALAQDATQYQLDAAHDGAVTFPIFSATPRELWSANLGLSPSYPIFAGGEVYVTASNPGNSATELFALNQQTGHTDWSVAISGSGSDIAAYDNGNLYVVDNNGESSTMNGYNGANGNLLWSSPLAYEAAFDGPTAINGVVYTSGAGTGGILYARSESNGSSLYSQLCYNGGSLPTVVGGSVFISADGFNTECLDATTGALKWDDSFGGSEPPVYYNGNMYLTESFESGAMYCVNPSTGVQSATFHFNLSGNSSVPAFFDGIGYIVLTSASTDWALTAFNASSGQVIWSDSLDGQYYVSAPIVINGVVYVALEDGFFDEFNGTTGALIASVNTGSSMTSTLGPAGPAYGLGAGDELLAVPMGTTLNVYAVPEPTAFILIFSALASAAPFAWKRRVQRGTRAAA